MKDTYDYNTKYGKLSTLKVKYFSYGLINCGGTCGPFKTREAAEKSRSEDGLPHGQIFESEVEGLEALKMLEKMEEV